MSTTLLAAFLLVGLSSATVLETTARIPKKGLCNDAPNGCDAGLSCVGNVGNKRCFPKREAGAKCGKDPFWVCVDGLTCAKNGRCIDASGVKESCNEPGDACAPGLSCVGNLGNKRCFPPRLMGDKCGKDPFWVCQAPLVCSSAGMCVLPQGKKGSCNAPTDACKPGLVCVGNVGNKRCFTPRREGDKCGEDPFWNCVDGLTCSPAGMCVKGVPVKGSCNVPGDVCSDGLICVGNVGNKRCFPPRLEGDKCGKDPFWECAGGFTCVAAICK